MQGRSGDGPQQWSVHAHFTISHPGMDDPNANQQAHTDRDENGVHMSYSWSPQQMGTSETPVSTSTESRLQPSYGFQKGNLLFTTIPPRRPLMINNPEGHLLNVARTVEDSGYNSALLSPNSCVSNLYPRRPSQMCNHKCRSTCSIVLSTTINEQPELEDTTETVSQCGRTQSLRCQTPSVKSDRPAPYYGCGDPWCHHSSYSEAGPFSPTQGSETSCSTGQTVMYRPIQEIKKIVNVEDRKDAAVQTLEMVDKCTSPFMMKDSFFLKTPDSQDESVKKEKSKRRSYSNRSRTEPISMQTHLPSSFTPDSLESYEPRKRLVRQSATKISNKSPLTSNTKTSLTESKSSDSTKKPRTVHIDVYCTGTEQESEDSSSEIESKTASSPQTVFESQKVRITHSRSHDKDLPIKLREMSVKTQNETKMADLKQENESDDDNASTAYPSQISSYSAIGGLSSFSSSIPPSWSTYSVSVDNDYDSVANTSWKDTFSDFDSVNRSRSSVALTDSLDFVPKRLRTQKSESIEEQPELDDLKKLGTPSTVSLNPSDSFEYANSEDRFRIKRMEETWSNKPNKQSKSPQLDRKHLLQQQKLKEYVEKKLKGVVIPKQESRDSDSESDSSEKGWSVIKSVKGKTHTHTKDVPVEAEKLTVPSSFNSRRSPTLRSPSILALQQKLTLNPTLGSPFMIVPGIFTDQRTVAKKFGSVVEVYKKPGHHIGPAKNPECQCDHCRSFFKHVGSRGRARSFGEDPNSPWSNWKRSSRYSQPKEREPKDA